MRDPRWRERTVDALSQLLTWYARREVSRLKVAHGTDDGATTPSPSTASGDAADGRAGVPSLPRSA